MYVKYKKKYKLIYYLNSIILGLTLKLFALFRPK